MTTGESTTGLAGLEEDEEDTGKSGAGQLTAKVDGSLYISGDTNL